MYGSFVGVKQSSQFMVTYLRSTFPSLVLQSLLTCSIKKFDSVRATQVFKLSVSLNFMTLFIRNNVKNFLTCIPS